MENKCPICNEPSYKFYKLCKHHLDLKNEGKVIKNDDSIWVELNNNEQNKSCKQSEQTTKKQIKENENNEITCILCGQTSNNKHFCYDCWNKYKDKSIDVRISNCNSTQILDEYGNRTKKAKDGRFVRSLSEKIILDYFFDNYIRVVYEKTIPYINEKGEEKELHPDFYLMDYDLYIEFNGLTNKSYLNVKNYANKIYKDKNLNVEILESSDIDDIESTMTKLLDKYKKK